MGPRALAPLIAGSALVVTAHGYPRPTRPHIDALARRGLVFRSAENVQSGTWPALRSLHTGLYPSAYGVIWNGWKPRASSERCSRRRVR